MSLFIKPVLLGVVIMQEPAGVQQTGLLLSRICPCCHGCKAIARGEEGKGCVTNRCVAVVNRSLSMYQAPSIVPLLFHLTQLSPTLEPSPSLSLSFPPHPPSLSLCLPFPLSNSYSPFPPSFSPWLPVIPPLSPICIPLLPQSPCLPPLSPSLPWFFPGSKG